MRRPFNPPQLSTFNVAISASCGMSTLPNCRILLPSSPELPAEHMRCDDGVVPLIFRYLDVCFATKATWLLRSSDMTRRVKDRHSIDLSAKPSPDCQDVKLHDSKREMKLTRLTTSGVS